MFRTSSGIILVRLKDLAAMEVLPKSTVVLVLFVLWVPLAFCRNATSGTVSNETVPPTLSFPPSTPLANQTTTESSTTAGSWFFWRRSVGGNGTVPRAESYAPHNPVNASMNVTGTPNAESLVTRSSDTSTVEMSSTFAPDEPSAPTPSSAHPEAYFEATTKHSDGGHATEPTPAASTNSVRNLSGTEGSSNVTGSTTTSQSFDVRSTTKVSTTSDAPTAAPLTDSVRGPPGSVNGMHGSSNMTDSTTTFQNFVVPSTTEATTTSDSAASTDIIRDRSGMRADMNSSSNATESTFQRINGQSTTEVPTTSSAPEDTEATSDGSCPCHDAATPSTSAQPVTIQQQAHVTHSSEDTSTSGVVHSPTGNHPLRVPQTPAQTSTTTTTGAPDYIV
ncbi:A-agglutinin anchorage subunit, putative [Ixodes scapularis]|uniref:A-agglutinin anchorage subunit, putative n=1 Tax=Ixodes scapularis TaxID=6945 RepID=B7QK97_IXOSC|nr:A-agglutinin anchorage subunit, putative [Ixodes scapularis]|eukprot:XP_002415604.1 A-agglutinin anchorage subunit, putative [Ixodes scapularis]